MRFEHPAHPGRALRLAYCTNLLSGETVEAVRAGLERIALPLRERLAGERPFGVGLWLAAAVAGPLSSPGGFAELCALLDFVHGAGLDPFTFNAFPYGGFHAAGLKEGVYRPTWSERERLEYTLAVAKVARVAANRRPFEDALGHVSISTHPGGFGAWTEGPITLHGYAEGLAQVVTSLARAARAGGPEIVLSLEAEPRASANDSVALAEFLIVARTRAARLMRETQGLSEEAAQAAAARHLGTCLDCCHSAVELEDPREAWRLANLYGALGKLQFSSALALAEPGQDGAGRAALLAMDEPRYLHQVTGRGRGNTPRCADLPELAALLAAAGADPETATGPAREWLRCHEWRCHFHVPVDLERVGGLGTTRAHADAVLAEALADPGAWTTDELHVEIETYTWDVLPRAARGAGELVDGLEREYRHVLARLDAVGWHPA